MNKLSKLISNPIYYQIDEKNKVVIATMYNTKMLALDFLLSEDSGQGYRGVSVVPAPRFGRGIDTKDSLGYLEMNDRYTAKAFCSPDDVFDADIGKKVAKRKLLNNVKTAIVKRLKQYCQHLDRCKQCLTIAEDCQI